MIVGHTRWKAAKKLGLERVPVHIATELTPAQAKAYRIADNKTGELAAGLSSFGSAGDVAASDARKLLNHQNFDVQRDKSKATKTSRKMRPKDRPLANDFVSGYSIGRREIERQKEMEAAVNV